VSFALGPTHVLVVSPTKDLTSPEIADIATKLNLIPPVADQCQHQ